MQQTKPGNKKDARHVGPTHETLTVMKRCKVYLSCYIFGTLLSWMSAAGAGVPSTGLTEEACGQLQDSEIIWHLSEYRWLCCIPKNADEYETCIPITDMQPPPKTSLKPFPPETSKTIKPEKK